MSRADESSTAILIPLFDRRTELPYCAMTVLNVMSLRAFHSDLPILVCDYSQSPRIDEVMAYWSGTLNLEIRKFSMGKSPEAMDLRDALSIRYDAVLRLAEPGGFDKLICTDADVLATAPVVHLADGEFHGRFLDRSKDPGGMVSVSDTLFILNMASEKALRLVALTRSLHQDPHVWRHMSGLAGSQPAGYSERLLEVAARLLQRDGFGAIHWRDFDRCYLHYARHNKELYPRILETAGSVLDGSGHMARFTDDFGDLEPLIFRTLTT